jgi:hypothetical protein
VITKSFKAFPVGGRGLPYGSRSNVCLLSGEVNEAGRHLVSSHLSGSHRDQGFSASLLLVEILLEVVLVLGLGLRLGVVLLRHVAVVAIAQYPNVDVLVLGLDLKRLGIGLRVLQVDGFLLRPRATPPEPDWLCSTDWSVSLSFVASAWA